VQKETAMAKGRKRGNRELRKPKAIKPAAAVTAATAFQPTKGFLAGVGTLQRKR
jgi:hypothetical protein